MLNMATPLPALAIIKIDPSIMLGIPKSHLKLPNVNTTFYIQKQYYILLNFLNYLFATRAQMTPSAQA